MSLTLEQRALADLNDHEAWTRARDGSDGTFRIGASDAAKYAKLDSVDKYIRAKLMPSWSGGRFADWGNTREPIILAEHGYEQNTIMYRSHISDKYVATPDGIDLKRHRLAQVKTTVERFKTIPAHYRRQVWWEQFVMGPEYTQSDFIFEHHRKVDDQFIPEFDSTVVVIDRDEEQINKMIEIAIEVLIGLEDSKF